MDPNQPLRARLRLPASCDVVSMETRCCASGSGASLGSETDPVPQHGRFWLELDGTDWNQLMSPSEADVTASPGTPAPISGGVCHSASDL